MEAPDATGVRTEANTVSIRHDIRFTENLKMLYLSIRHNFDYSERNSYEKL